MVPAGSWKKRERPEENAPCGAWPGVWANRVAAWDGRELSFIGRGRARPVQWANRGLQWLQLALWGPCVAQGGAPLPTWSVGPSFGAAPPWMGVGAGSSTHSITSDRPCLHPSRSLEGARHTASAAQHHITTRIPQHVQVRHTSPVTDSPPSRRSRSLQSWPPFVALLLPAGRGHRSRSAVTTASIRQRPTTYFWVLPASLLPRPPARQTPLLLLLLLLPPLLAPLLLALIVAFVVAGPSAAHLLSFLLLPPLPRPLQQVVVAVLHLTHQLLGRCFSRRLVVPSSPHTAPQQETCPPPSCRHRLLVHLTSPAASRSRTLITATTA